MKVNESVTIRFERVGNGVVVHTDYDRAEYSNETKEFFSNADKAWEYLKNLYILED